jgi:hypothetical protein
VAILARIVRMRANNNPDASSLADASQPKILRNFPPASARKTPLQLLCASAPDRPPWKHLMGKAFVIAKDHSHALGIADSASLIFCPALRRVREPRLHPSHQSRVAPAT